MNITKIFATAGASVLIAVVPFTTPYLAASAFAQEPVPASCLYVETDALPLPTVTTYPAECVDDTVSFVGETEAKILQLSCNGGGQCCQHASPTSIPNCGVTPEPCPFPPCSEATENE